MRPRPSTTKGMRSISTIWGRVNRSVPNTPECAATEVAHIAHEKARLERELEIWVGNANKVRKRLSEMQERLVVLQAVVARTANDSSTAHPKPRRGNQMENQSEAGRKVYRKVEMEY